MSEAAGVNSAGGSFGLSFGLAFAGAMMLASLSSIFTRMADDSDVLSPDQQQQVADALEDDAELMSNTQLAELLAGQPPAVQAEIIRINTDARPRALQIALLVPIGGGADRPGRRPAHAPPSRPQAVRGARGDAARVTAARPVRISARVPPVVRPISSSAADRLVDVAVEPLFARATPRPRRRAAPRARRRARGPGGARLRPAAQLDELAELIGPLGVDEVHAGEVDDDCRHGSPSTTQPGLDPVGQAVGREERQRPVEADDEQARIGLALRVLVDRPERRGPRVPTELADRRRGADVDHPAHRQRRHRSPRRRGPRR